MVLLKDILNQDSSENTNNIETSPAPSVRPLDKRNTSLPSPNFSAPSSSNGNSDSDDDSSKCRLGLPSSSSHVETPQSGTPSSTEEEQFSCKWDQCGKMFNQPELLYHHLCQDHIGRKSQRNLQLACKWKDCNVKTEKRDHITSHLRVHVPLKPFDCSKCGKKFKRPQDLKKHLKVHVESHIVIKKKRGPKVGSKRIQKKPKEESEVARNRLSSASSSISSPSPTPEKNYPLQQTALPRISFQQLISNEIPSYEPVYTQQLGTKLRTVLPSLNEEESLPRSPSVTTQNAAGFFTALSKNMSSSLPNQYNTVKQPVGTATTPSTTTSTTTPTTSPPVASALQPSYKRPSYPEIYQLPPIAPHPANMPPERVTTANGALPSLNSVPVLNPRYNSFERLPHFNAPGKYFSSNQKSNNSESTQEEELLAQIDSLRVDDHVYDDNDDEESQDIFESLEIVNIIRDYLLCSLVEQEFEDDGIEQGFDNRKDFARLPEAHNLSRYPQVVI